MNKLRQYKPRKGFRIDTLPSGLREIAQQRAMRFRYTYGVPENRLPELLDDFEWTRTPEGHDFWYEVFHKRFEVFTHKMGIKLNQQP